MKVFIQRVFCQVLFFAGYLENGEWNLDIPHASGPLSPSIYRGVSSLDISRRDRHSCLSWAASETSLTGRNACRYPLLPLKSQNVPISKVQGRGRDPRIRALT